MGSMLSVEYNPEETYSKDGIIENDDFFDALDEIDTGVTDNMNQENLVTDAVESKFSNSVLSDGYNNLEQPNQNYKIIINNEFHDALDKVYRIDHDCVAYFEYHEYLCILPIEIKFSDILMRKSKLTYEVVTDLESELNYYEKVALVFLLFDEPNIALPSLLVEHANIKRGSSTNLLSNWAKSKHLSSSSWQDRFVEAVSVIQNYTVLRRFGLDKKHEMKKQCIPTPPLHLNKVMKALYRLCTQLSVEIFKILLTHLAVDFQNRDMSFLEFDENYLELYFLYFFSMKYISENNLSNLIAILQKMGLDQEADALKFVVNINIDRYIIDPENVGICLIINQKRFYKKLDWKNDNLSIEEKLEYAMASTRNLEERQGTDVDKASLCDIFTKLGLRVIIRENLIHRDIIPNIKEVMRTFSTKDSYFVVCILSHGAADQIYGANSIPVYINDIKEALHDRNYTALLGKPKILVIQSCQGTEIQKVICPPSEDNETDGHFTSGDSELNLINYHTGVPEKRDLIVCMSTVSGFASIRDRNGGTWYIQELCKTIKEKCEEEHFQDILTAVNNKVSNKRCKKKDESIVTMVPESTTTLSMKLYLQNVEKTS